MEINLYFLARILHFQPLFCTTLTVLTEKGQSTTETPSKICLSFYAREKKEKGKAKKCFFIARFTQAVLLQVTLNSQELLSRNREMHREGEKEKVRCWREAAVGGAGGGLRS